MTLDMHPFHILHVMPSLEKLKIPSQFLFDGENLKRQAHMKTILLKSIAMYSYFAEAFTLSERNFGVERSAVADLIRK